MQQQATTGNKGLFEKKLALTTAEIAIELGFNEGHIRRLVSERRIPFTKIGRSVRFIPEDIRAWLKKGAQNVQA